MRVLVRYFAAARECAGTDREELELPDGSNAQDAMTALVAKHPALGPIQNRLRVAVNQEFTDLKTVLPPGAELALIPPVAGGSGRCAVRSEPITLDEVVRTVSAPEQGGIVTFSGMVRDHSRGRRVLRLKYEAYGPMAERQLEKIADQAKSRFSAEVAILHRVGDLTVGDVAVVIAAASPHREQAFEACRFAIEELKRDVPIWKKETYVDGVEWVGLGP